MNKASHAGNISLRLGRATCWNLVIIFATYIAMIATRGSKLWKLNGKWDDLAVEHFGVASVKNESWSRTTNSNRSTTRGRDLTTSKRSITRRARGGPSG